MNLTLILAILICLVCTIMIFWNRAQARTIDEYETLIWVQDEIITQYREKYGDMIIDLSKEGK